MTPRPSLRFGKRTISSFTFCGLIGVIAAIALAMTLTAHRALPLHVMAAIIVAAIATFFAVIFVTRVITGEEQIIYYHHEIAVLAVAALVAYLLRAPVRAYLDATLLGIGAFLFCGRIGCLLVGCCHGRPSRFGVCYGDEHVARGFTWYYAGVRLFPLQLVEALWVLGVVIAASRAVWIGEPYGGALALYIVAYDFARFVLEYFRGDAERPYTAGLSQAQWISFWLTLTVVSAEWRGVLPFRAWHIAIFGVLVTAMVATMIVRRAPGYLDAQHVGELAAIIAAPLAPDIVLTRTPRGLCVSASEVNETAIFAFSSPHAPLTRRDASSIARLVMLLRREDAHAQLIECNAGVYEVVLARSRTDSSCA